MYVLDFSMHETFSLVVLKSIRPHRESNNYTSVFIERVRTNSHTIWVINLKRCQKKTENMTKIARSTTKYGYFTIPTRNLIMYQPIENGINFAAILKLLGMFKMQRNNKSNRFSCLLPYNVLCNCIWRWKFRAIS